MENVRWGGISRLRLTAIALIEADGKAANVVGFFAAESVPGSIHLVTNGFGFLVITLTICD